MRIPSTMLIACGVIVIQWIALTYLLYAQQSQSELKRSDHHNHCSPATTATAIAAAKHLSSTTATNRSSTMQESKPQAYLHPHQNSGDMKAYFEAETVQNNNVKPTTVTSSVSISGTKHQWEGVAATLALRAPKWFHRRYTAMILNILDNTPETWAVQLFVHPEWWQSEILTLHRGMQTLLSKNHPRIIVTELPRDYWKYKPKQVFIQPWFWETMVADQVFLFSGNGVMCAHALQGIQFFKGIDFCGAPSRGHAGGDGSTHSLRNRNAMLDAIAYAKPDMMNIASESTFFTSTLQAMNNRQQDAININTNTNQYRLATKNETILFAGGATMISENNQVRPDMEQFGPSLVLSGTGMNLPWEVRDALLQICPEWKLIFPSLHEPSCFGATPVADKCAASICALQPDRPKRGC